VLNESGKHRANIPRPRNQRQTAPW
jgi:hypothetical protein